VKPKTFYRHYQNVSIFCFKKYESLLAEDQRIAHEIQKKQEEERDSESEKNKITVSYSFQPINFCIIHFRVILLHLVFFITLRYLLRLFGSYHYLPPLYNCRKYITWITKCWYLHFTKIWTILVKYPSISSEECTFSKTSTIILSKVCFCN